MSLTSSLTNSVRSATYNPEAEKAMKEEREKAERIFKELRAYADAMDKSRSEILGLPDAPQWSIKKLDEFTKGIRKWIQENTDATELQVKAKQEEIIKQGSEIFTLNLGLMLASSAERVLTYLSSDFEQKKLLNAADRKTYSEFLAKLKKFNASNKNPTLEGMKTFGEPFAKEIETFAKAKGFDERQKELLQTSIFNPKKFEEDMKGLEDQQATVKQEEAKEFSVKRFAGRVTATASTVIGTLFYIVFCLTIGMLAANQAIGREPAYRVLYFIYGAIFAPFLMFYYIYLWFNNKSPKIYTLLPLTQQVAGTSIGQFFLFPFTYKEDKPARDLLVEFLTQSAEMVGKTFDAKTLGSIGKQVEAVAENLKNLTAEASDVVVKAAESLPSLDQLRVNALKPNSPT